MIRSVLKVQSVIDIALELLMQYEVLVCNAHILFFVVHKVIHSKNYKHLKKCAHQSHLCRKNGQVSGRLACKTEILNKIGV